MKIAAYALGGLLAAGYVGQANAQVKTYVAPGNGVGTTSNRESVYFPQNSLVGRTSSGNLVMRSTPEQTPAPPYAHKRQNTDGRGEQDQNYSTSISIETEPSDANIVISSVGPGGTRRYSLTSPETLNNIQAGTYRISITKNYFTPLRTQITATAAPLRASFRLTEDHAHAKDRQKLIQRFRLLKNKYEQERVANAPLLAEIASLESTKQRELDSLPSELQTEHVSSIDGTELKSENRSDYYTECYKVEGCSALGSIFAPNHPCHRERARADATRYCSAIHGPGEYTWLFNKTAYNDALRFNNAIREKISRLNAEIDKNDQQQLEAKNRIIRENNAAIESQIGQIRARLKAKHIDEVKAVFERLRMNFAEVGTTLPSMGAEDYTQLEQLIARALEETKSNLS